jgi:hypothetical protein
MSYIYGAAANASKWQMGFNSAFKGLLSESSGSVELGLLVNCLSAYLEKSRPGPTKKLRASPDSLIKYLILLYNVK